MSITNGALIHYVCNLYKYNNYYVTVLFDYNCNNATACASCGRRAVHKKYIPNVHKHKQNIHPLCYAINGNLRNTQSVTKN